MAEETETCWLVVADGEGSGETRIVMGDDAMVDAVLDMVEGTRDDEEKRTYWREYVRDMGNWIIVDSWRNVPGQHRKERWRLTTELGETGHLMIQLIDKQDMMDIV